MSGYRGTALERFNKYWSADPETGCWEWKAYKLPRGYGLFRMSTQRRILAHRAIWELKKGKIPEGLCICHKCDNPGCVNPDHLFIGTHKDNSVDMKNKGRNPWGEKSHLSKLRLAQVEEIRKAPGTHEKIALDYGVDRATIGYIKRGDTWGRCCHL
jgi:hypothetical protein